MTVELIHGDALDALRRLPDASVDAVCTDPPAGIHFMSASWDHHKGGRQQWVAWLAEVLTECRRVMKPGAYALVWALPRTSHWTGCAIEDSGLIVRDCLTHLFGSGFPKSQNVSAMLDKAAGAEREVVGNYGRSFRTPGADPGWDRPSHYASANITAPATDLARQWEGFGTSLKPSSEHWYLAQKPLDGTYAANVQKYGVGALAIDACRVGYAPDGDVVTRRVNNVTIGGNGIYGGGTAATTGGHEAGRWPPNTLLSHSPDCRLVGTRRVKGSNKPGPNGARGDFGKNTIYGTAVGRTDAPPQYADPDGYEHVEAWECARDPSGAYICPVALLDSQGTYSDGHRPDGVLHMSPNTQGYGGNPRAFETRRHMDRGGPSRFFPTFAWSDADDLTRLPIESLAFKALYCPKAPPSERVKVNGVGHPTQKPLMLVSWLCRLVCPPGGTLLDPFAGSGTTLVAAHAAGFNAIGVEQDESYVAIIRARLAHAERQTERAQLALPLGAD